LLVGQRPPPLPDVQAACERAVAHNTRCEQATLGEACLQAAKVESVEMTSVYNCVAEIECDDSVAACLPPKDDELADAICERLEDYCDTVRCDSEWRDAIATNQAWWSATTIDAATACLEERSCSNLRNCLSAWSETVFEGTSLDVYPWDLN